MTGPIPRRHPKIIARKKKRSGVGGMGRASAVGIELAIAVVGCLIAGWWLDGKLGTDPWLTLGGLVLGSGIGFRSLWRAAQESAKDGED